MTDNGIVNIRGKDYMTVAKRVELWLEDNKANNEGYSIETEVIPNNNGHVAVKAVVKYKGRTFTGISSVDLASPKMIEKSNPYEVAETSAVGRALGFAGYGIIEGIASADEMVKTGADKPVQTTQEASGESKPFAVPAICEICGKPATERKGLTKSGKNYHGVFCSTEDKSHTRWLWN